MPFSSSGVDSSESIDFAEGLCSRSGNSGGAARVRVARRALRHLAA